MLSLMLNLAITSLHVPVATAAAAEPGALPAAVGELGTAVLICTASGVRVVTLDASGDPVPGQHGEAVIADCALCSVLNTATLAPAPDAVSLAAPRSVGFDVANICLPSATPAPPRLARGHDPPKI